MKILLTLAAVLMLSVSTFAQKEMSRDEAISFLNQKLSELKGAKINDENEFFVRASLRAEGNKITARWINKEVDNSLWSETYVFNPADIKSMNVIDPPADNIHFISITLTSESGAKYYNSGSTESELDDDPRKKATNKITFRYLKGDGTNGAKLEKALMSLKELAQTQPQNSATKQQSGPSLEDTVEYINSFLKDNDGLHCNVTFYQKRRAFISLT